MMLKGGTAYEIHADPQLEITQLIPDAFVSGGKEVNGTEWEFPAASVTAMELEMTEV